MAVFQEFLNNLFCYAGFTEASASPLNVSNRCCAIVTMNPFQEPPIVSEFLSLSELQIDSTSFVFEPFHQTNASKHALKIEFFRTHKCCIVGGPPDAMDNQR